VERAARNINGKVIMFADIMTDSMKRAIEETERRRKRQFEYNENKRYPHQRHKEVYSRIILLILYMKRTTVQSLQKRWSVKGLNQRGSLG
jgi:excinuclease UvrABC helicase subunit UvrB